MLYRTMHGGHPENHARRSPGEPCTAVTRRTMHGGSPGEPCTVVTWRTMHGGHLENHARWSPGEPYTPRLLVCETVPGVRHAESSNPSVIQGRSSDGQDKASIGQQSANLRISRL
ncbi:hypothetical protein NHX12_021657 [Muraenolepis orangiensis]|uniref:Uncharacterized protein n=1 Tax=Muraenolepis orangiensis TaxID=630683 RepID=A0A9Q0EW53_9TELE|nr:hypothetical protein NHX12_021657 [Muraenolepis orangiensis]